MANRMKEDEKNEKIIRGLLKLSANRRCINCNSLGPQYVCTNFWTFICTNCSGIHREFTHRVKSVSMAKFTSQEVKSLQEGGNERAREIYFKEWDPQRHSFPDSSNVDRLRDFIKHVYVDRRFTGERSVDRPPRVKGDREDLYENRRFDMYRGGSRSPPYDETYDRRYNERPGSDARNEDRNFRSSYEERRSPGYDQGDHRRSPGCIEITDGRRDNKFGSQNRRFEERRFSDGVSRSEGRSPDPQKVSGASSPPTVHPVRDILGEGVPPLRVGEPPKSNGSRVTDGSAQTQRTSSSSSMGPTDGNSVELRRVDLGSLIDFSTDPEPAVAVVAQKPVSQETTSLPANSENWASFDFATQHKPQAASNVNTLESALVQLAAPGSTTATNVSMLPTTADFFNKTTNVGPWSVMQQNHPSLFPAADSQATALAFAPSTVAASSNQSWASLVAPTVQGPLTASSGQPSQSVAPNVQGPMISPLGQPSQSMAPSVQGPMTTPSGQPSQSVAPSVQGPLTALLGQLPQTGTGVSSQSWISPVAPNVQGLVTTPSGQLSRAAAIPLPATSVAVPSQPHSLEAKPSGRREIPADLFTATFPPAPASVPGWQAGQHLAMGYGMQYPTAPTMHFRPHSSKSTNPFDLTSETVTLVHAPSFPSMTSLQGALPNMANPSPLLRSSSFGATPSPRWVSPQQSSYPSAMPPSAYVVQQVPSNMSHLAPGNLLPMGHQGIGGFSGVGPASGTSGMDQHLAAGYYQPGTPNSFNTSGGNPFG